ncbi:unnamed protein product [Rhizophagus irregularis]|nr:unnamed protein product [Rhizophagus irregularis]
MVCALVCRLLFLGISSLCQGLLLIRPYLGSLSFRLPFIKCIFSLYVGWECGFMWVWVGSVGCGLRAWVGSVGCGLGAWVWSVGGLKVWVGSIYSSPCLIVIHAFVVAVFETPVPLKNIRNQVNQVIKVTKAIKDVKVVRFMQMSSNIVLDQAARSEGSDLTAYSY